MDEWSQFAVKRNIYGGLDFDDYHAREVELEELDRYIQQLSLVLNARRKMNEKAESQTGPQVTLAGENAEPYVAPPIPLWKSPSGMPFQAPVGAGTVAPEPDSDSGPEPVLPESDSDQPPVDNENTEE